MKIYLNIIFITLFFAGCSVNLETPTQSKSGSIDKKYTKEQKEQIVKEQKLKKLEEKKKNNTIALIFPSSTIGKYALEATNSINTFLLYKNEPFNLVTLDMFLQTQKNINEVFKKVKKQNIQKVIAMITKDDLAKLKMVENINDIKIYLPLINKYESGDLSGLENLNLTFGGISYKDQFKKLIEYSNGIALSELHDNSAIGSALHSFLEPQNLIYHRKVDDNNGRYKSFLKYNSEKLNNSALILNTPIVKSSILLSAITSEELELNMILSTQLNYTPLLFSLTQELDRKNLVVANSIGNVSKELLEYNEIVGNNILYSWVNYSAMIGIEYLLSDNIDYFKDIKLEDNQVKYPVKLYEVGRNSFNLIK